MDPMVWIIGLVIAGVILCLAMILLFLWLVYARGGAFDLGTAAKALREVYDPEWPTKLLRYLPASPKPKDEDECEEKGENTKGEENEEGDEPRVA